MGSRRPVDREHDQELLHPQPGARALHAADAALRLPAHPPVGEDRGADPAAAEDRRLDGQRDRAADPHRRQPLRLRQPPGRPRPAVRGGGGARRPGRRGGGGAPLGHQGRPAPPARAPLRSGAGAGRRPQAAPGPLQPAVQRGEVLAPRRRGAARGGGGAGPAPLRRSTTRGRASGPRSRSGSSSRCTTPPPGRRRAPGARLRAGAAGGPAHRRGARRQRLGGEPARTQPSLGGPAPRSPARGSCWRSRSARPAQARIGQGGAAPRAPGGVDCRAARPAHIPGACASWWPCPAAWTARPRPRSWWRPATRWWGSRCGWPTSRTTPAAASLLRARRRRGRAGRRPAARDPVLRRQRRGALPAAGDRAVRGGLPGWAHAQPLRRLQHRGEVRLAPGPGARPVGQAGNRPLRPGGGARRPVRAPGGGRPGQGPELLPPRAGAGGAAGRPLPGGRAGQAGGAGRGGACRAGQRPQARLAGDLLRDQRRRGPLRGAAGAGAAPARGAGLDGGRGAGAPLRGAPLHGRSAARAGARRAPRRATWSGSRRPRGGWWWGARPRPRRSGSRRARSPGWRGRRRRARCVARVKVRHRHAGEEASVAPLPGGRAAVALRAPVRGVAPGRRRSSTRGTRCWAVGGSSDGRPRLPVRRRRPRRTLASPPGPA